MDTGLNWIIMDNLLLSDNMRYYSEYYKPCTSSITDGGWYNIPKKVDKFNPKEQVIVAYHNTHVVYAYKGLFNRNINYDWIGWILLDFKKIMDKHAISGSCNCVCTNKHIE